MISIIITTRITHQSHFQFSHIEGHYLITSSAWRNDAQAAVGGVGLLLSPKTKTTLCNVFWYSERVLLADFSGSNYCDLCILINECLP